jgi:hypothetical protein
MQRSRWKTPTWNYVCPHCRAPLLNHESKTFCCNNGRARAPPLPPLPANISSLLSDPATVSAQCLSSHSRKLNNLFSFTAIGTTKGFAHFDSGISTVAITGRTYHRIFDVRDQTHSLHWYLYDENERYTRGHQFDVPLQWVNAVNADLRRHNPYVSMLLPFHDIPAAETCALELTEPSSNGDFAAVMHAANSTTIDPRNILIWQSGHHQPSFVPILSRHYEPLQYPLLFPHGTPGWGLIERDGRLLPVNDMSQRLWYKSLLLSDSRFLHFGRLTCEYVCDMYSRIEEQRLDFIKKSRVNFMRQQEHVDGDYDRFEIVLPASFMGSKRWASEQTADSLALARSFGPLSLFITMTCNPDWPEIKLRLRTGQNASDIPSVVVRAFNGRLKRLKEILRRRFGRLCYMITVIEFQKRGLPHAHIVIKVCACLMLFLLLSFYHR